MDSFGIISSSRECYFLHFTWSLRGCALRLALDQKLRNSQSSWKKFRPVCTRRSFCWRQWEFYKWKMCKGGRLFFFLLFFPSPSPTTPFSFLFLLSQKHKKSDSGLTCNFKQNQIDRHAVANINLASCMTKLPIGKHHLRVEGKEKSPLRQCLTH